MRLFQVVIALVRRVPDRLMTDFPALQSQFLDSPSEGRLGFPRVSTHPPRILLCGALRDGDQLGAVAMIHERKVS